MPMVRFECFVAEGAQSDKIVWSMIRSIQVEVVHLKFNSVTSRRSKTLPTRVMISFKDLRLDPLERITVNPHPSFLGPCFVQRRVLSILPSRILLSVSSVFFVEQVTLTASGQNIGITKNIISNIRCRGLFGNFFRVLFAPDKSVANPTESLAMMWMPRGVAEFTGREALRPIAHC